MSARTSQVLTIPLIATASGMFLMQLDATVANLALTEIGSDFGAPTSALQWVIDGYTLPLAALLLIGGRIGDRVGHRRVFMAGLLLFGAGSLACAGATGPVLLVGARVLQGVGAALELPASLALLARCFPDPTVRARAIGVWASVGGLALAAGPLVGGPLVSTFGWQSVFVLNVPIVLVAAWLTWSGVPRDGEHVRAGLALPSQALGTVALTAVTVGIIEHRVLSARPGLLAIVLGTSLLGLAGFVLVERHSTAPLLPAALLRNRTFVAVTAAAVVMGFILFGLLFTYPLVFQQVQADSAMVAGLRLLPLAIAFVVTGPLAERAGARESPLRVAATGTFLLAAATALLALVPADGPYLVVASAFLVVGVGYGLLSSTLAIAALASLPEELHGVGSAVQNTARQFGGVLGVAIAGALIVVEANRPAASACLLFAALGVTATVLLIMLWRTAAPSSAAPRQSSPTTHPSRHEGVRR